MGRRLARRRGTCAIAPARDDRSHRRCRGRSAPGDTARRPHPAGRQHCGAEPACVRAFAPARCLGDTSRHSRGNDGVGRRAHSPRDPQPGRARHRCGASLRRDDRGPAVVGTLAHDGRHGGSRCPERQEERRTCSVVGRSIGHARHRSLRRVRCGVPPVGLGRGRSAALRLAGHPLGRGRAGQTGAPPCRTARAHPCRPGIDAPRRTTALRDAFARFTAR